ncbi:glycosyltransferase [Ruegeria atlantica]|uniref:Putative glycosyltransferase CsbB n=1 Tax=Ruegeria atlantica TaxID=81569 RepID=A0A0P1E390_9RHOB|nr:glycosyltransferase family 2 protein [Ruegeria atlantica]CUH42778.1 Putative glycosyltransferase CsbB [Ruegeria atlantica]
MNTSAHPSGAPDQIALSVVVPTFNEVRNVAEVVNKLSTALVGISWEVIFVDDASPDGTADAVRELARKDRRVRLISRHNRRGLSSAVVEGGLAAASDVVAVMDGDLQHDETILPKLYEKVASGEASIASASRFLAEEKPSGLSSETRVKISNTGIRLANRLFNLDLSDPLTGFFAFRRDVLLRALPNLSEIGFKILLDLIAASQPRPKVVEVPFMFRERLHGESKLDMGVLYEFFLFFIEKKISRFLPLPARFISFAMINCVGIFLHMIVFIFAERLFGASFATSQITATMVALTFNYSANNAITYNDRRLRGSDFYLGFVIFALLCSVGIFANIGVATMLHDQYTNVIDLAPAMAGALVTVVWNYVATQAFVWGRVRYPVFVSQKSERAKS